MVEFAAAIQFLLVSPRFVRRAFSAAELGRSTAFFPLVGALLGGLLAGTDALLAAIFSLEVRSALLLVLWIVLTGGLHFDGLLDACDGLLGGTSREQRLQIMRDERTGAYAVAGGALILLIMFSALNSIGAERWAALLLAPVLGRCGVSLCLAAFPYARREGLGWDIKNNMRSSYGAAAALVTLALVGLVGWRLQNLAAVAALLSAVASGWLAIRFVLSRIAGMTGDTYGAICMLVEAAVLLGFAAGT